MAVISRKPNARTRAGDLDSRIEEVLVERGACDPLALVQLLKAPPGDVVERVASMTVAGLIRVVDGRFMWGRS